MKIRLFGLNVLRGMAITLGHFLKTYWVGIQKGLPFLSKGRGAVKQKPTDRGLFTVQYPEERLASPERFRVLPILIYEKGSGDVRCTACGICAKVCPPQCIWIVQAKGEDGKVQAKAAEFTIDMDVCMNCGLCAEYCPFDAIKMDNKFELAGTERKESHIYNLPDLLVSFDDYAATHPIAAKQEEAARAAKGAPAPVG